MAMRVLLEQVSSIDFDGLLKQVTALSNKERIAEVDVKEDRSKVYRYGTVAVRWSYLSEKWILQDGVAIEGTYETAKDAIRRAKEVSGYEEETRAQIIHTEPVPIEFDGAIPLDLVQSFQPSSVSSPVSSPGGGGGGAPVSLNTPSLGGSEGSGGAPLGDQPSPAPGGPSGLDTALPGPATPGSESPVSGGAGPSAADLGV